MCNGFFSERGRYLFENEQTDPFSPDKRSKTTEHSPSERSKNNFSEEFENSQKLKKIEEIES